MKVRKILWLAACSTLIAILLSACNMGVAATEPPAAPTMDPGAIQTEAYRIAFERQTQTAQAIPPTAIPTNTLYPTPTFSVIPAIGGAPTPTPLAIIPGFTPLASPVPTLPAGAVPTLTTANGCNDALYEGESAPYDGAELKPNKFFEKSFSLRNTGSCPWDEGYSFQTHTGYSLGLDQLRGSSIIRIKYEKDFVKPGKAIVFILQLQAPNTEGTYKWCYKMRDDANEPFGPLVCVNFWVNR